MGRHLAENQPIAGKGILALAGSFLEHREVKGARDAVGTIGIHGVEEPMESGDVLRGRDGVDETDSLGTPRIMIEGEIVQGKDVVP